MREIANAFYGQSVILERPDERPHDLTSDDDPIDSGLPAATGREALLHPGPSVLRSWEKRLPWSLRSPG